MRMRMLSVLKSGVLLDIYFFKNNRSTLISLMLWPYLMLGMLLGFGLIFGSTSAFKENIGMDVNPITYFVSSTVVIMACLGLLWDVAGSVLELRWLGALPYVILAPYRISLTLILSYVPRYLLISVIYLLEFTPLIILVEGLADGILKLGVIFTALTLGMLPMIGFAGLLAVLFIMMEEESNVLSWLNPLIMLFSGAFYPAYLLPHWAQTISRILPSTYTIEMARLAALMGSPSMARITFLMGLLIGFAVLYNILAYSLMGAGERRAMQRGAI